MPEKKKMGRPTDNPKSIKLQIRVDEKTMRDLDQCAEKMNSNRSEVVRTGIDLVKSSLDKK